MIFTVFIIFFSFLPHIAVAYCPISVCNSSNPHPTVLFPFRLCNQSQSSLFPDFDLSCNSQKQTIITLPSSGDFSVDSINCMEQTLFINDIEKCLTKRFLKNDFTLAGSPFSLRFDALDEFTFLKCSSNNTVPIDIPPVSCLGDDSFSYLVIAVSTSTMMPPDYYSCSVISRAVAPKYLDMGVELAWNESGCSFCEDNRLRQPEHGNSNIPEIRYLSESYYVKTDDNSKDEIDIPPFVIGGGVMIVLLICCFCHRHGSEPSSRTPGELQLPVVEIRLEASGRQTIESYPKIQLGETLELPEPDKKTCPICLCDYQAKETLITIPECNHYFHANCVDPWLRKNPTCPVCRNLPNSSVTGERLLLGHACHMPT